LITPNTDKDKNGKNEREKYSFKVVKSKKWSNIELGEIRDLVVVEACYLHSLIRKGLSIAARHL